MSKFKWENGSKIAEANVEINGNIFNVNPAQYEGKTPLSAQNLNKMQDGIYEDMVTEKEILDTNLEEYTQKEGYLVNEENKELINPKIPRYESKLLWSKVQSINADFKAQTITIDKKYKIIDVVYTSGADANNNPFYRTIRCYRGIRYNLESNFGGYIRNRSMMFGNSGSIVFGDGYIGNSGSLNVDNHQCSPHFIYGVTTD